MATHGVFSNCPVRTRVWPRSRRAGGSGCARCGQSPRPGASGKHAPPPAPGCEDGELCVTGRGPGEPSPQDGSSDSGRVWREPRGSHTGWEGAGAETGSPQTPHEGPRSLSTGESGPAARREDVCESHWAPPALHRPARPRPARPGARGPLPSPALASAPPGDAFEPAGGSRGHFPLCPRLDLTRTVDFPVAAPDTAHGPSGRGDTCGSSLPSVVRGDRRASSSRWP